MSTSLLIDAMPIRLALDEGGESGKVIARGEFARCDVPTQNGRSYPRALYEREIDKLQDLISRRRMFGELDHPADGKTMLQRVSHIITKLEVADDGRVIGEAEILDTPNGKTLKAILQANAEAGVSSRGFGSTKPTKDGGNEVGDDFVLRTFDFVADPAMMTAYPDVKFESIDTPEFTVDDLTSAFPDLVEQAQRSAQDSISEIIEKERNRVRAEAETQFAAKLASSLKGIRESVLEDVKREYETVESSQAQVALHKIAEVLAPIVGGLTPNQEKLQSELGVAEQRINTLESQLTEAKNLLKVAGYAIHVESSIGAHPKRESIKRLLGKVSHYESVQELDARLDEIKAEFEVVVAAERNVKAAEVEDLQAQLESLQSEYNDLLEHSETLSGQVNSLTEQNNRLRSVAQSAEVTAYKRSVSARHTNSQELMNILEGVDSKAQVDRLANQFGQQTIADSDLESLRQRVKRGNLRRESASLEESTHSASSPLDVSFSELKALAGIN